jgi:hypothetical protein
MSTPALSTVQAQFESALPTIHEVARFAFRKRRHHEREEAIAEAQACAWKAWCGLARRGKDPVAVGITGIAGYAVRHVLNGRRLGNPTAGGRGLMDIHHPRARRKLGYTILSLDARSGLTSESGTTLDVWKEWLAADHRPGPADQAAFRVDFAAWLAGLPARRRRVAERMAGGWTTGEVARELGVSPAAISMTRATLARSWRAFQGEAGVVRTAGPIASA